MEYTFKAALVDDEELARRYLRELLASHPEIVVAAECANGFEAVKAIAETSPDLLFLDAQMPKLDGLEVLELIASSQAPVVIFVTAYDHYAMRAFDAHATVNPHISHSTQPMWRRHSCLPCRDSSRDRKS